MQFPSDPSQSWLTPLAWVFLLYVGVLLPWAALRQNRRMAAGGGAIPSRMRLYFSAFFTHAVFVLLVWMTAGQTNVHLLEPLHLRPAHLWVGVVALVVGLLPLLPQLQINNPVGKQRAKLLAPRTVRDHAAFYGICVSAGIAEELVYRGLFFVLLSTLLGGWWVPALLSSTIFGVVHLFQGWKSAGIAGLMGLREHIVVGFTGSLFVAMAVHMLHDVITGTVISWRVRRADVIQLPTTTAHEQGDNN